MKVIICGAGRVGQGIAQRLAQEHHHITIVDANPALVDEVSTDLDVRGIVGHAAYPDVLANAGAEDSEMIIAVTQYDEINMVICQIAHTFFNVSKTIARVRARAYTDKRWRDLFSREGLPIDMVISPEREVSRAIVQRLRMPGAAMGAEFAGGRVHLLMLDIERDSPLVETTVDQIPGLFPDLRARVIAIGRGERLQVPRSNDKLVTGERVYIAVLNEDTSRLNSILSIDERENRHVTIIGAGAVGFYLAEELEKNRQLRVRLIEKDAGRANRAVSELKRTIVIHGDGLDREILEEAGAMSTDYLIAITDDDRTNLMACNLAKRAGARQTMALVNEPYLMALRKDMRVDAIIDPRALTVSQILRKIRRGRIKALRSLEDGRAEVIEGVVSETSPLIGQSLGYDELPDGITAVAIRRGDEVIFPSSKTVVEANDRLIVLFEQQMTRSVEEYFRVSAEFFH